MDGQPCHAVERVLDVYSAERCYVSSVLGLLFCGAAVVVRPANTQSGRKLLPPSWVDLLQDS